MSTEEAPELDKVFTEWVFFDHAGNKHTVRPWSLNKSKITTKILGQLYAEAKTVVEDVDFWTLFNLHLDLVFTKFIDPMLEIICITLDKNKEVLDYMDIALGIEVIEVIWKQNFTGERVKTKALSFLQTLYPGVQLDQKENSNTPLDQEILIPGLE